MNPQRLLKTFLELAAIPSPSHYERGVADYVRDALAAAGLDVREDDAAAKVGGNAGNIIATLPGTGEAIFLAAHMDTVPVTGTIKPVVDGDVVRSDGTTILGADDKCSIAVLLELVRTLRETGAAHRPLELVFTVCEEIGLHGAAALDLSRFKAKVAYALDGDEPNRIVVGAPSSDVFDIVIHGRGGHATKTDDVISPIRVAAEAITRMPFGQVDPETTANVGIIEAGTADNVVPETALLKAEVRSHDKGKLEFYSAQLMLAVEQSCAAARLMTRDGVVTARADIKRERKYEAYRVREDEPVVQLAMAAIRAAGMAPRTEVGKGAQDANVFNLRGLRCVALGAGMRLPHTPREYLVIGDLAKAVNVALHLTAVKSEE